MPALEDLLADVLAVLVVWGEGARPFRGETVRVRLLGSETFDSGVTLLRYAPTAVG